MYKHPHGIFRGFHETVLGHKSGWLSMNNPLPKAAVMKLDIGMNTGDYIEILK